MLLQNWGGCSGKKSVSFSDKVEVRVIPSPAMLLEKYRKRMRIKIEEIERLESTTMDRQKTIRGLREEKKMDQITGRSYCRQTNDLIAKSPLISDLKTWVSYVFVISSRYPATFHLSPYKLCLPLVSIGNAAIAKNAIKNSAAAA